MILSLSDEEIANAQEAEPTFAQTTLAPETYPGQAQEVVTIATPNVLVVAAEMEEQLAYDFLSILYDNIDEIIAIHPSGNETTPENSVNASPVPLHAGAVTYYQEQGIDIPEHLLPPQ